MKFMRCSRCGHRWITHVDQPKICPSCHSVYWHTPPSRFNIDMLETARKAIINLCIDSKEINEQRLLHTLKFNNPQMLSSHYVRELDELVISGRLKRETTNNNLWPMIIFVGDIHER